MLNYSDNYCLSKIFVTEKESKVTQYQRHLSARWDNLQSQSLKRGGSEKKECLGGLKESLPQIFAGGRLTMFLVKKDYVK